MEEVLGADSATKQLPGPFKALPRLLRDDALAHLKREYKGTVTLQSDHPLKGTSLSGKYRLHLPGAAQLTIQIDARSELDGSAYPLPLPLPLTLYPTPTPTPHQVGARRQRAPAVLQRRGRAGTSWSGVSSVNWAALCVRPVITSRSLCTLPCTLLCSLPCSLLWAARGGALRRRRARPLAERHRPRRHVVGAGQR